MKKLFIIIIIFISFQSWTKADDIRDFEIEGMSIGDSLLDHFNKNEIKNSKVDWYQHLEKDKFITTVLSSSDFMKYEYVDVNTKYGDNNYIIDTMSASIYFGKDKFISDINECYIKQNDISKEFTNIFKNSKREGPIKFKHLGADPSGKSTYTDIYFYLNDGYTVLISCYDFSDHLKSEGSIDFLAIILRSNEVDNWMDNF